MSMLNRLLQPLLALPAFAGIAVLMAAMAIYAPGAFFQFGALTILATIGVTVLIFPSISLGLAVLSLGLSPENFVGDQLAGIEVQSLHKLLILVAVAANLLRHGLSAQFNGPVAALGAIFLLTIVFADIHYRLTTYEMVKSLIGFIVPFAFISAVYRREAIPRFLLGIALIPVMSVALGFVLNAAGLRNAVSMEYTGAWRLSGMNIPAFLAYFAFIGMFVATFEGIRYNSRFYLALAGVNFGIIVLTGTRMPILAAALFGTFVLLFSRNEFFHSRTKANLAIAGAILSVLVLLLYWPQLESRLYGGVTPGVNLSGRTEIWEHFIREIHEHPLLGQGIGTGKILVLDTGYLGSAAAHNEYLRFLVDFGVIGLVIYLFGVIAWVGREFRFLQSYERVAIGGFLLALAVYSITDNTMTSPPPVAAFFAITLFFLRARYEAAERQRL
jgi:teichuronic acid biosynthesis protein TuaE